MRQHLLLGGRRTSLASVSIISRSSLLRLQFSPKKVGWSEKSFCSFLPNFNSGFSSLEIVRIHTQKRQLSTCSSYICSPLVLTSTRFASLRPSFDLYGLSRIRRKLCCIAKTDKSWCHGLSREGHEWHYLSRKWHVAETVLTSQRKFIFLPDAHCTTNGQGDEPIND